MKHEIHVPVLVEEVINGLNIKKNSVVIDATADGGGHSREILKKMGPEARLLCLDWDKEMTERLENEFRNDERVKIIQSNFSLVEKMARTLRYRPDAIFFDLGLSSFQLQASGRGFSFLKDEPLKMTYDENTHPNAKEIVNKFSEEELGEIIKEYGEERLWRKIAKTIVEQRKRRPIETSKELADTILKSVPRRGKIHPATKTFQALRIFTNKELENIKAGLDGAWNVLEPEGRICVISFHSLEDRIVKRFFKGKVAEQKAILINKKVITPAREEITQNPRSRSSKLRIIQKI